MAWGRRLRERDKEVGKIVEWDRMEEIQINSGEQIDKQLNG